MRDDTASLAGRLSPEARRLYARLTRWWLTRGEWLWTRRDLHQRVKSASYYRRVAELDPPLAELLAAGLLRRWSNLGLSRVRRGPAYAYVRPEGRAGRRRGRLIVPHAAPMPVNPLAQADPLIWRIEAMCRQFTAANGVFLAPARPDRPAVAGCCPSCGEALPEEAEGWCTLCVNALIAARSRVSRRSTRPG